MRVVGGDARAVHRIQLALSLEHEPHHRDTQRGIAAATRRRRPARDTLSACPPKPPFRCMSNGRIAPARLSVATACVESTKTPPRAPPIAKLPRGAKGRKITFGSIPLSGSWCAVARGPRFLVRVVRHLHRCSYGARRGGPRRSEQRQYLARASHPGHRLSLDCLARRSRWSRLEGVPRRGDRALAGVT